MFGPWLTGFATSFSLILAIGAQNAFVLRQGLKREHVFWLCLFCAGSDAILITAGITGFGAIISVLPDLPRYMAWGGAAFMFYYGLTRFYAAWKGDHELENGASSQALGRTIAIAAAFTWANPHVYLDTLVLIGAISSGFHGTAKVAFGVGAVLASFIFFFALGYGARILAPIMQSPRAWRWLDTGVGILMMVLAYEVLTNV